MLYHNKTTRRYATIRISAIVLRLLKMMNITWLVQTWLHPYHGLKESNVQFKALIRNVSLFKAGLNKKSLSIQRRLRRNLSIIKIMMSNNGMIERYKSTDHPTSSREYCSNLHIWPSRSWIQTGWQDWWISCYLGCLSWVRRITCNCSQQDSLMLQY